MEGEGMAVVKAGAGAGSGVGGARKRLAWRSSAAAKGSPP